MKYCFTHNELYFISYIVAYKDLLIRKPWKYFANFKDNCYHCLCLMHNYMTYLLTVKQLNKKLNIDKKNHYIIIFLSIINIGKKKCKNIQIVVYF